LLIDLQTRKKWWTGKSNPHSSQESLLVCINDFSSHFIQTTRVDKILSLGCHDLNLFSNRALANSTPGSWRNLRILKLRELGKSFQPSVVIQHPHTADTPRIWRTAWSGLTQAMPSVKIYAGAGRWYNPNHPQRGGISETLRATAKGPVSTFFIKISSRTQGMVHPKMRSLKN
jgi:hypothetical protein